MLSMKNSSHLGEKYKVQTPELVLGAELQPVKCYVLAALGQV